MKQFFIFLIDGIVSSKKPKLKEVQNFREYLYLKKPQNEKAITYLRCIFPNATYYIQTK